MFGHGDYTKKCIDLTLKNAGMPVDILVVDDCSPEPFEDKRVDVIRLDSNVGFTQATNRGILYCGNKYPFIHCLNNDTEPRENFIKELYDVMQEDRTIAIASSIRLYDRPGEYNVELYGTDLIRGFQLCYNTEDIKERVLDCNWVPICSALIRFETLRYIGILDRRMKNHCSDNDLCIRAKMDGWRVVVCPKSKVFHYHEVTTTAAGCKPEKDQMVLLEKIAGFGYKQLMAAMPIDGESNTWGDIEFKVYKK